MKNGIGTADIAAVSVIAGTQHLTADFGYVPMLANISGRVRYDTDVDGDFNDPDNGALAVKIQLWNDPNADNNQPSGSGAGNAYEIRATTTTPGTIETVFTRPAQSWKIPRFGRPLRSSPR